MRPEGGATAAARNANRAPALARVRSPPFLLLLSPHLFLPTRGAPPTPALNSGGPAPSSPRVNWRRLATVLPTAGSISSDGRARD